MSVYLSERTWPEVQDAVERDVVVLLPLGQTEQHGRHLQIGCDTIIAERVCAAVAEAMDRRVLVMPPICYGYVPKAVQEWPATFRVRWNVMVDYVADVCTSAVEMGFRRIVVVSTHGPHGDVARLAARLVFDRTGVGIIVSMPHSVGASHFNAVRASDPGGTSHAGEYETSLLLHFGYPVDLDEATDSDTVKECNEWVSGDMLQGSGKVSWSTWALQQSDSGTYGDPTVATADTGKHTFEGIVREYCRLVEYVESREILKQKFPTYPHGW